ncbi:MAG TPA: outer membrane beta-barrel protein [Puia sp.]|jgi:hypothetical protein|nr:outer membrane beta-barrel protein [Puia sp.]
MKKLALLSLFVFNAIISVHAQGFLHGLGLKAGPSFTNVSSPSSLLHGAQTGFTAGIFKAPNNNKLLGLRIELLYLKQSYSQGNASNAGEASLDYISWSNMLNVNITKYFSCMIGEQLSYLLNAKADSSFNIAGAGSYTQILKYFNRIDFGLTAGMEIHPFKGIGIGARYTWSVLNMFKSSFDSIQSSGGGSFGNMNQRINVLQLFLSYKF